MLALAKFPTDTLLHKPVSQYLRFPSKSHFTFPTRLNFVTCAKLRNGFSRNALKTKKKGDLGLSETDGPDELDEDFDEGFLDAADDDDGSEDEIVIPLMNMKKFLENRPRGFGEGKAYDTSVEDKLMEEIERGRKAQLENVNKLKNGPVGVKTGSKKEMEKQSKGSTDVPKGFRVRLLNLPKKKNIRKDLRLAFEGVCGMLNIVPVVSGNEKTRDPVCKGLAFIDFKNQDDAKSFVQQFSGKSIDFGKVQKQIKCEMVIPKKADPTHNDSDIMNNLTPTQAAVCNSDVGKDADVKTDLLLLEESREESGPSTEVDSGADAATNGTLTTPDSDFSKEPELTEASKGNSSLTSNPEKKMTVKEKKAVSKKRKDKNNPKLKIPGSANRLKIREKEMLTGVLSKYGAQLDNSNRIDNSTGCLMIVVR